MRTKRTTWVAASLAAAVLAGAAAPAFAQAKSDSASLADHWQDFIHYIQVYRPKLAEQAGAWIVKESGAEPREVYRLAQKTKAYEETLKQGEQVPGLKKVIADIRKMIRHGLLAEAKSPKEIARTIQMLGSTMTGYQEAVGRLKIHGEYALPQLLHALSDSRTDPSLRDSIVSALPQLGKAAVRGMSVALQSDDAVAQEALANALGQIGYGHAAARLKELASRKDILPRVLTSAKRALAACAQRGDLGKSVSELFYELGEQYYQGAESLRPDAGFDTANVWHWSQARGLTYSPVPRKIFLDIYAARMARLALAHDKRASKAVSLWLAARLRKEASGATDPLKPANEPSATYYTLAAGPRFVLDVLARGLNDRDSAVAMGAIQALARTGGAESLVQQALTMGKTKPLIEALTYPDRHVRFLAAAALADALPGKSFDRSPVAMTVLVEALRQHGQQTALLAVAGGGANRIADAVRKAGYAVVLGAGSIPKALDAGREASGIDIVVLSSEPDPVAFIRLMRRDPLYAFAPVVVAFETAELARLAGSDKRIVLVPPDADAKKLASALDQATKMAIGKPMTPEQADAWAVRIAKTIRMLGLTGNKVLRISRATPALIGATRQGKAPVQVAAAEALAVMSSSGAQTAIADLATSSKADEAVRRSAFAALSESLRRFGNLLPRQRVEAIQKVVTGDGSRELLDAAAQTHGAMFLESENIKDLIAGGK